MPYSCTLYVIEYLCLPVIFTSSSPILITVLPFFSSTLYSSSTTFTSFIFIRNCVSLVFPSFLYLIVPVLGIVRMIPLLGFLKSTSMVSWISMDLSAPTCASTSNLFVSKLTSLCTGATFVCEMFPLTSVHTSVLITITTDKIIHIVAMVAKAGLTPPLFECMSIIILLDKQSFKKIL